MFTIVCGPYRILYFWPQGQTKLLILLYITQVFFAYHFSSLMFLLPNVYTMYFALPLSYSIDIVSTLSCYVIYSAVDKPKFMGRPPDHPWWKTGSPKSFLGCPNYFDLSWKDICFLVVNTKLTCFPFNHVPTYRRLGRPSGDFEGHVRSYDRVMGRI